MTKNLAQNKIEHRFTLMKQMNADLLIIINKRELSFLIDQSA